MARYFYSIRIRERVLPDREGVDLNVDADPMECGRVLCSRLREALSGSADLEGCFVEVSNPAGDVLAMMPVLGRSRPA